MSYKFSNKPKSFHFSREIFIVIQTFQTKMALKQGNLYVYKQHSSVKQYLFAHKNTHLVKLSIKNIQKIYKKVLAILKMMLYNTTSILN